MNEKPFEIRKYKTKAVQGFAIYLNMINRDKYPIKVFYCSEDQETATRANALALQYAIRLLS